MREIKFRVWHYNLKKWYTSNNTIPDCYLTPQGSLHDNHHNGVDMQLSLSTELCFYIGLKDKNDKEIYEGDIIKRIAYGEETGIVVFDNASFKIRRFNRPYEFKKEINYLGFNDDYYDDGKVNTVFEATFEIIGNIYENPELIKDKI